MKLLARHSTSALCTVLLAAVAGCSSAPQREAEWTDPALQAQPRFLQGEKVLVACDAYDLAIRQICQQRLVREVTAAGASPVSLPSGTVLLTDRELDGQLIASAAEAGAKAVLTVTLTPASSNAGSGVSLGIGGFSFGRGGGGGIGLGIPIGGGSTATGFAANGRVTDVRSNRLMWTATAVAAPSADLEGQFTELTRSLLDSARKAGVF